MDIEIVVHELETEVKILTFHASWHHQHARYIWYGHCDQRRNKDDEDTEKCRCSLLNCCCNCIRSSSGYGDVDLQRQKSPKTAYHAHWDSESLDQLHLGQFSNQPLLPETSHAIQSPESIKPKYASGYHAFAFAWFRVLRDENKEDQDERELLISSNHKEHKGHTPSVTELTVFSERRTARSATCYASKTSISDKKRSRKQTFPAWHSGEHQLAQPLFVYSLFPNLRE